MSKLISMISILVVVLFAASSCDRDVIFEENIKIPGEQWHKDSLVYLTTEIKDTVELYNIYLNLRHSTEYDYKNLYLFFETVLPNGQVIRDTVECILANRAGKWLGQGHGRIKSHKFHFREDIWFPYKGEYVFVMQQAMREETLNGITDVGIRIERK